MTDRLVGNMCRGFLYENVCYNLVEQASYREVSEGEETGEAAADTFTYLYCIV